MYDKEKEVLSINKDFQENNLCRISHILACEDFFLKFDESLHGYSFGYVTNPFGVKPNSQVTRTVQFDDAEKYMKIILGVHLNETLPQLCENQHQNFEDPQIEQQQQQQQPPLTPPPLLPLPQPPTQNEEKQLIQPPSPPSTPPPQQIKTQKFNNCSLDYSIKENYTLEEIFESNKKYMDKTNNYLHFLFTFIDKITIKDLDHFEKEINRVPNIKKSINQQNMKGETPLHSLIINNSKSCLKKLVITKINHLGIFDYSKCDNSDKNLLNHAIEKGDIDVIKLVLIGGCPLKMTPKSRLFKKNFKIYRQQIYRILEINEFLTKIGFHQYIPMFLEFEFKNININYLIQSFINKVNLNADEILLWKLLSEPYKSLDLESFCSEYQIKDQNGLISETTANHFKNVSQLNPLFGYIDFHAQIGTAGNAFVFEGTYKSMPIACKEMLVSGTYEQKVDSIKEIAAVGLITKLCSKTVVKTIGVLKYDKQLFLVMVKEKCNLLSFLSNKSEILKMQREGIWTSIFKILTDILEGVISLREDGIFHRDFKTANFLVSNSGKILISDFGTSRDENEKRLNTFAKTIGTLWYRCPRLGDCSEDEKTLNHYNEKSEIYSLGIILWELVCVAMTGTYVSPKIALFQNEVDFSIWTHKDYRFSFPVGTPQSFVKLITSMCLPSRERRPTIDQIRDEVKAIHQEFLSNRGIEGEQTYSGLECWREFNFSKQNVIRTSILNLHEKKYKVVNKYNYTSYNNINSLLMKRYLDNSNFVVEFINPNGIYKSKPFFDKEKLLYLKLKSTYKDEYHFDMGKFLTTIIQIHQITVIYYKMLQKYRENRLLRNNNNNNNNSFNNSTNNNSNDNINTPYDFNNNNNNCNYSKKFKSTSDSTSALGSEASSSSSSSSSSPPSSSPSSSSPSSSSPSQKSSASIISPMI
ncbi:hypothetical protein ACTFIR_003600 [Dictyostelium discoideum]